MIQTQANIVVPPVTASCLPQVLSPTVLTSEQIPRTRRSGLTHPSWIPDLPEVDLSEPARPSSSWSSRSKPQAASRPQSSPTTRRPQSTASARSMHGEEWGQRRQRIQSAAPVSAAPRTTTPTGQRSASPSEHYQAPAGASSRPPPPSMPPPPRPAASPTPAMTQASAAAAAAAAARPPSARQRPTSVTVGDALPTSAWTQPRDRGASSDQGRVNPKSGRLPARSTKASVAAAAAESPAPERFVGLSLRESEAAVLLSLRRLAQVRDVSQRRTRFRELQRSLHPDKWPVDGRNRATHLFQVLQRHRDDVMNGIAF